MTIYHGRSASTFATTFLNTAGRPTYVVDDRTPVRELI